MSDDGSGRSKGPFGPLELLDEVQRQAFDAALRVTAELTSLGGGLADVAWLRDGNGASRGPDDAPPLDVGRLRSDVAKAADTFAELLRALLDVGFDAMDELARRPDAHPSGRAEDGAEAHLTCVVRNGPDAATGLRAHVPQLASVDGDVLAAEVAVAPERFDLAAHERIHLTISVRPASGAVPGRYHGLLLVAGLPDAAHPISVDVGPEPSRGDD